jgi:hypothetical protein
MGRRALGRLAVLWLIRRYVIAEPDLPRCRLARLDCFRVRLEFLR